MAGSHIVLTLNIMIAVAFASAFFAIYCLDRRQEAARWFALAYAGGASEAALYIAQVISGVAAFRAVAGLFLAAMLSALVVGVAKLYGREPPKRLVVALASAIASIGIVSVLVDPTLVLRYTALPVALGLMMLLAATPIWRAPAKSRIDRLLLAIFAFNAVQFFARPVSFFTFVHGKIPPAEIVGSGFAIANHAVISFCAVSTALVLLTLICLRIKAEADDRAVRDPLTGLLNRRGFEEGARPLVAACPASPAVLVIADIDRFKQINDRFGHAFGDEVIRGFAALLAAHAGDRGLAGRIGGEEFALLLTGTDAESALAITERLRERFAAHRFAIDEAEASFTASFGLTELAPGDTLDRALQHADHALYEAKNAGRDRVATTPARKLAA